jgi:hypothetical protein
MARLFGDFDVRVDPWEVDYGSETPLESVSEQPEEDVALDVDIPVAQWKPVAPAPVRAPTRLWFVDGIRRLESRLVVRQTGRLLHGAFGSFAVGGVDMGKGKASFGPSRIHRQVVLGSGQQLAHDVPINEKLVYQPRTSEETEPNAPLRALQANMRSAEGLLARELSDSADSLVIADGPLSFEAPGRGTALGFIKRITQLYLPAHLLPLLAALPAQTRTPLFSIRARRGGFARLAWYIRLAPALWFESELHGLARLEIRETAGLELARKLADMTASLLPRYAPTHGRDPRSPQNLLPIGLLEQHLRHLLGDALLIRRWIQSRIAKEAAHART